MNYSIESREDLGPRVRFFGGGSQPKAPPPPPAPPLGPTQAELEAAAKARMLARQRRGRKSTILAGGQVGDLLGGQATVLGGTTPKETPYA
jgi:hypothetical protein